MSEREFIVGPVSDERVTYFVRDWGKYDSETGTLPEWEEYSYDPNDPALVAMREEIERHKDELRQSMARYILSEPF